MVLPFRGTIILLTSWVFCQCHVLFNNSNKVESNKLSVKDSSLILNDYRLPKTVTPFWYDLTLRIYLPGTTFYGQVTTQIRLHAPTSVIEISNDGLDVYYGFIIGANFVSRVIHVELKPDVRKVILHLDRQIASSDVRLTLYYRGFYSNDFKGLYVAQFNDNAKRKNAILSFNSPLGARKMVPCFDEIEFKASWKVTVIHPVETAARSNGPVASKVIIESGKYYKTSFEPTNRISSYLLAIVVGEMFVQPVASAYTKSGILINIFSKESDKKRANGMLTTYIQQLNYLERRFGVPLNTKKIDNVIYPEFIVQGMENQGLISFSEKVPSIEFLENVGLITHELVHQWIGNNVSPANWAVTFLKEGIATFYEKEFSTNPMIFANGMEADSWHHSHALLTEPKDLFELSWNFDDIVYQKGGAVFSMLRWLIGITNFDDVMRRLILQFSNKIINIEDVANLLDSQAYRGFEKPSLGTFFKAWVTQPHFPLLTVSRVSGGVVITAKPFLYLNQVPIPNSNNINNSFKNLPIPIWYRFSDNPSNLYFEWMFSNETKFIPIETIDRLIFVNTDNYGFYRVTYDAILFAKLIYQIQSDITLPSNFIDRILVDALPLLFSGHLSPIDFFALLEAVKTFQRKESTLLRTLHVLNLFSKEFGHLRDSQLVQNYTKNYFKILPQNIDGDNYVLVEKYYHAADMKLCHHECVFGIGDCPNEYREAFREQISIFCKQNQMLSECYRSHVPLDGAICAALQTDSLLFDYFLQKYEIEEDFYIFQLIAAGLACTHDIERLFELLTTPQRRPHIDPAHYSLIATALTMKQPDQMQRLFLAKITEPDANVEFLMKSFSRVILSTKADYGQLLKFSQNHATIYNKFRPAFNLAMEKAIYRDIFERDMAPRIIRALEMV